MWNSIAFNTLNTHIVIHYACTTCIKNNIEVTMDECTGYMLLYSHVMITSLIIFNADS